MKKFATIMGLIFVAWVVIAEIVFAFRHPWASETERFLHIVDAMKFRKVPYETMRPRD